jgi:hypothetical protein
MSSLEIATTIETLRSHMIDLVVRGLASVSAGDLSAIRVLTEACDKSGMAHLTGRLETVTRAIANDAKAAPSALLSAYTSLHVFERVLSLEVAASTWEAALSNGEDEDEDEDDEESKDDEDEDDVSSPAPALKGATMEIPAGEEKKLAALLDELAKAIEDLVRTGLTSATEATRAKLDVSFKEASRMKLLRLGASLRYVNEEVGRFLAHSEAFSTKRFVFFVHRSWLLAKGISEALRERNDRILAKLLMTGAAEPIPVKSMEVVTLGVLSRTVQNAFTFDFRLRVVKSDVPALVGQSLVLGLVFARKSTEIAAEAFLHLPQPQKYHPKIFTERAALSVTASAVVGGRLVLGPKATVIPAKTPKSWSRWLAWAIEPALARVRAHEPSPLDLPVELQEEVVLTDWTCAEDVGRESGEHRVFVVRAQGIELDAVIPAGSKVLAEHFEKRAKAKANPPLFGLVHYELGRLVMSPLSLVDEDEGPTHLMLSNEKINLTALLGSLTL